MRVAIDARKLEDFGIGTYLRGLLRAFARQGVPEQLVVYLAPGQSFPAGPDDRPAGIRIECRTESARPYSLAELWRLALRVARDRVQLFHAPHYVCPPFLPCPAIVTVHDLIHLRFPSPRRHRLAPLYARVMLRLAIRRAARVITVSESTRRDLETWLGADPARLRVIPNGVEECFRPAADPARTAAVLMELGITRPYWLFVGNPLPHKNLAGLLEAHARLPAELGGLVLAGIPPFRRAEVEQAVGARGLGARVQILAPLPGAALPAVYQGATALVSPSLWEGFGLPALEAMACGTPVVASDRGALPEVLGGAGLLVDPTDVDALREALYNLAADAHLRAALRAAGLTRARAFSWRGAAEATLAVYREVLERRPGS